MNGSPPYRIMCSMGAIILKQYTVFENDIPVGTVKFFQEGMFFKLCFNYQTNMKDHKLICFDNLQTVSLGTGIPEGNKWSLTRFLPAHELPQNQLKFELKANENMMKLIPGEPVVSISKIANGRLHCCEDGYWIVDAEDS